MKIAAHQPNYLPNLAFFNKMNYVDTFVIISNIQFEKHEGWQQRHKIQGPNGDIWLTVPVLGSQNQLIKDVKINTSIPWQKKQQKTLLLTYGKGKGKEFLPKIVSLFDTPWERLVDLNFAAIQLFRDILEIKTPLILDEEISGTKHVLITNICKKYNDDTYVSGIGAKDYLKQERIHDLDTNGIKHEYVEKNLTAQYPYSTIHYLLLNGKDWVCDKIS